MTINYKDMSHDELIGTILLCQHELNNRGTVTHCKHVAWTGKQKTKYITFEQIHTSHKKACI
jgi:hypothetical protein